MIPARLPRDSACSSAAAPAVSVQGDSGMAKRTTTSKPQDDATGSDAERLDFDLAAAANDLDIAASMEDLEAQISKAADELAREGRGPATPAPKLPEAPAAPSPRKTCRYPE